MTHQVLSTTSVGTRGAGGVAAPLKIGVNSTKLTGCEEHVHFTRRVQQSGKVKNMFEGKRTKNVVEELKGIYCYGTEVYTCFKIGRRSTRTFTISYSPYC